MTRLTIALKNEICANAINQSGIPKHREKFKQSRCAWAEKVRVLSLSGPEKAKEYEEIDNKITQLRENVPIDLLDGMGLRKNIEMRIIVNSHHDYYQFDNVKICVHCYKLEDTALIKEWEELGKLRDELNAMTRKIRTNVNAILNSVTTIKKLQTVWPEVEKLLPSAQSEKALPPAIRTDEVNKLLGF